MKSEFLEVSFGDVFRSSRSPHLQVVVDMDEFAAHTGAIHQLEDGREVIDSIFGSHTYRDIEEIVERWALLRIREGLILGCQASFHDNLSLMGRMIEIVTRDLELNAQKPAVILRPK